MSQRTEVRVKKTSERRSLRFAGLEFAPPVTAEERAEAEQVLADASASGDYSKVPPPREPTTHAATRPCRSPYYSARRFSQSRRTSTRRSQRPTEVNRLDQRKHAASFST